MRDCCQGCWERASPCSAGVRHLLVPTGFSFGGSAQRPSGAAEGHRAALVLDGRIAALRFRRFWRQSSSIIPKTTTRRDRRESPLPHCRPRTDSAIVSPALCVQLVYPRAAQETGTGARELRKNVTTRYYAERYAPPDVERPILAKLRFFCEATAQRTLRQACLAPKAQACAGAAAVGYPSAHGCSPRRRLART